MCSNTKQKLQNQTNRYYDTHNIYDNGIRFFYWDYYKTANEINDPVVLHGTGGRQKRTDEHYANDGYCLSDWYVGAKHKNLKNELLQNEICCIGIDIWSQIEQNAQYNFISEYCKNIQKISFLYDEYQLHGLHIGHIISMMVYCNTNLFQLKFSETFRRNENESDESFKKRNSNYAQLARLLREFVECFGENGIGNNEVSEQRVYRGISVKTNFSTINPCVKGPFSATTALAVAVSFSTGANQGLILQFRTNYKWFISSRVIMQGNNSGAFVDCHWLSNYTNEQERFFIGGFSRFWIDNIIVLPDKDYYQYILAIRIILERIDFREYAALGSIPYECNDATVQIAFRILFHELNKHFPQNDEFCEWKSMPKYIDNLWHNFCINLKRFVLWGGFAGLQKYKQLYALLSKYFMCKTGMFNGNIIVSVFPCLEEIWIEEETLLEEYGIRNVDLIKKDEFWCTVIDIIDRSPNLILIKIMIQTADEKECSNSMFSIAAKYGILGRMGWNVWLGMREGITMPIYYLVIQKEDKLTITKSHQAKCQNGQLAPWVDTSNHVSKLFKQ
eukprot:210471_1